MSYNPRIEDLERKVKTLPSGGSVPVPSTEDVGKIPVVNADGEYELANAPSGLPEVTSADEGKVLAVNASGEWAASAYSNYDAVIRISYDADRLELYGYNIVKGVYSDIASLFNKNYPPSLNSKVPKFLIELTRFSDENTYNYYCGEPLGISVDSTGRHIIFTTSDEVFIWTNEGIVID